MCHHGDRTLTSHAPAEREQSHTVIGVASGMCRQLTWYPRRPLSVSSGTSSVKRRFCGGLGGAVGLGGATAAGGNGAGGRVWRQRATFQETGDGWTHRRRRCERVTCGGTFAGAGVMGYCAVGGGTGAGATGATGYGGATGCGGGGTGAG